MFCFILPWKCNLIRASQIVNRKKKYKTLLSIWKDNDAERTKLKVTFYHEMIRT